MVVCWYLAWCARAHAYTLCRLTLDLFCSHCRYDLACIDYFRMLFSYMLKSSTPEVVEQSKDDFNKGLYLRRIENLVWLVQKAVSVTERVEAMCTV